MLNIKKLVLASALMLGVSLTAAAHDNIFVMGNAKGPNVVTMLKQKRDGSVEVKGVFPTGGQGAGVGTTVPFDPLGSQNSVILNRSGRWLFNVNAGSDSISVFKVRENSLELVDVVDTHGRYPTSVAEYRGLVYVLNAIGDASISGYTQDEDGKLTFISNVNLKAGTPDDRGQPFLLNSVSQISFSPDGEWLVMTKKNGETTPGSVTRFRVGDDGKLGAAQTDIGAGAGQFGFLFDRHNNLIVSEALSGTISSYRFNSETGAITSYARTPARFSFCWLDFNGKYLYGSNPFDDSISGFRVGSDGSLTPLTSSSVVAQLQPNQVPTDVRFSRNGRYFYGISSATGTLLAYKVDAATGLLTKLSETSLYAPFSGMQGITAE